MSSNEIIERLVVEASSDPLSPEKNFAIAVEYEKLHQTASAVSFYLRAAEYGINTHPLIAYASLLRISMCAEQQRDRVYSVTNAILQAIAFLPERPEGYFLMARYHERARNWQECYTYAQTGLAMLDRKNSPLPVEVDYFGEISLLFEKAVSAWWIGRRPESVEILTQLQGREDLPVEYQSIVKYNIDLITSGAA